jgi:hypothetical protein
MMIQFKIDKPDEDDEIPVDITLYMCCPEHTAKVLAVIINALEQTVGDTIAGFLILHNSIKEEFKTHFAQAMIEIPSHEDLN